MVLAVYCLPVFANEKGNGGDSYAIDFMECATIAVKILKKSSSDLVDPHRLAEAIDQVTVESTEEALILDGARKDAINYPLQKRIIINRSAWSSLPTKLDKIQLALHEYLGILGIDDSVYQVSRRVMKLFGPAVIRCESRFAYRSDGHMLTGDVEGAAVLDLRQEGTLGWKDDLRSYSVTSGAEFLQFEIYPADHSNPAGTATLRASLDLKQPQFYARLPVETDLRRKGGRVFFIEILCR